MSSERVGVWGRGVDGLLLVPVVEEEEEKKLNLGPNLGLRWVWVLVLVCGFCEWVVVVSVVNLGSLSLGMEVQKALRHPVTIVGYDDPFNFSLFSFRFDLILQQDFKVVDRIRRGSRWMRKESKEGEE